MNVLYELFKDEFGDGIPYKSIPEDFFVKYKGILPDSLLEFWREENWCSYGDGLFWTVNPEEFTWLVEGWVKPFVDLPDSDYFVVARTAFGEFFCLCVDSLATLTICCPFATLFASDQLKKPEKNIENAAGLFFSGLEDADCDFGDDDGEPLFQRALTKLGPLGANEIYGFVPMIPAGGSASLVNLQKVRMDVHIDIISQMADLELQWI